MIEDIFTKNERETSRRIYVIRILICKYHHRVSIHRGFMRHEAPQIQKALESGNVFVKKVSANAVIEIVEFEDEGSG